MSDSRLHTLLDELHQELQRAPALDSEEREMLNHLAQDVQALLTAEGPARDESVVGRLNDAVAQFEVSHPDLTRALSQLLNSLSQGGV